MSTFHPEQNPAVRGGNVYAEHGTQDKQIVRIIGKMTTLAAHAYHRNTGRTPAGSEPEAILRGKFPLHARRRARPASPPQPAARQSVGRHVPTARGARDELLDRGGEAPREQRRGRVQRRRGRGGRVVRAAPRRRQRGAFAACTLVPVRSRRRGERRFLKMTFSPGGRFSPPRVPRWFQSPPSTPFNSAADAFQLHPAAASYGQTPSTLVVRRCSRCSRASAPRTPSPRSSRA